MLIRWNWNGNMLIASTPWVESRLVCFPASLRASQPAHLQASCLAGRLPTFWFPRLLGWWTSQLFGFIRSQADQAPSWFANCLPRICFLILLWFSVQHEHNFGWANFSGPLSRAFLLQQEVWLLQLRRPGDWQHLDTLPFSKNSLTRSLSGTLNTQISWDRLCPEFFS